jgi:hypothetical protein
MSMVLSTVGTEADPAPVLRELWISFVGLTRSHLAALQTTGKLGKVMIQETTASSFVEGDLDGNIAVSISPLDGRGTYEMKSCGEPSDRGTWRLLVDGTACVNDGSVEEMELAVEFFAQKLVAARLKGANL